MAKKKAQEKIIAITLVKSPITSIKPHKATLKALGLRRMHQTVEHVDNQSIRGMIARVDYLVSVTEKSEG